MTDEIDVDGLPTELRADVQERFERIEQQLDEWRAER